MRHECRCPRAKHVRHGSRNTYRCGCRCTLCRVANAAYKSKGESTSSRHGIDPTGTQRRLQALYALGWGWKDIGDRLGMFNQVVYRIASGKHKTVMERTADRIAVLYDELSTVRPEGNTANWIRSSARRHGYVPALAWDDELIDNPKASPAIADGDVIDVVAIKRALDGREVKLTQSETDAVIAVLVARGDSNTMIGKKIGAGRDRANRVRKELAA